MRIFILMALLWFFIGKAQSQEQYNDKGIYTIDRKYENWGTLFFLNGKIIRQYNYIPRDYLKRLFINSQALDSNRLSLESFIKLKNKENRLYGTSYHTYNTYHENGYDYDEFIYEINLGGSLRKVATFRNMWLMPGNNYYYGKELNNDSILYKVDPSTGGRTVFTETPPYVLDTGYLATGGHIFNFLEFSRIWQLSPTNYLMLFTDCSGDCSDYRYLLYNDKIKQYRKISRLAEARKEEIKYYIDKNEYGTSFLDLDVVMKDLSDQFSYVRQESRTFGTRMEYVMDENANIVTPVVKKSFNRPNYNYQSGKVVSVMAHTVLDNGKKVFIPYKFTLPIERSFYRIYNGQEILKEDLKQFGKYELSILKNFIFAKHNYAFSTDFYQAYFNLFEFYHDEKKRASRTKDMNSLLTEADTKNLELINKALKKYD